MHGYPTRPFVTMAAALILAASLGAQPVPSMIKKPDIEFGPCKYVCRRAAGPIAVDGMLNEDSWQNAEWTEVFGDIQGKKRPAPRYRTRVQMLWDDQYLYVGAYIEEPNLWATLTARDSIIFEDNDFEVFIDPDGDSHQYYEIELNALSTVWDLLLIRPYRDGGPAVNAWDMTGLKTAVNLMGTLNDPSDKDKGWTVELAIPFSILRECISGKPERPAAGETWRLNFSRVEYWLEAKGGRYEKMKAQGTDQPLPEENWTWSPQGLINMHYPEMWSYLQFSGKMVGGKGREKFIDLPDEKVKWALRNIYYGEWGQFQSGGSFSETLAGLGLDKDKDFKIKNWSYPPVIRSTPSMFEAAYTGKTGETWHIRQDGLLWKTGPGDAAAK